MQNRFKYTNRIVFTFVTLGLVLFVSFASLLLITNMTLTSRIYFLTILDDANGLSGKPAIYFKGFQIGRISHFELDSNTNKILVRFYIYENYTNKIIRYAVISRIENVLLGTSNEYEILLPKQDLIDQLEPLVEDEFVPFINSKLGQVYAKKGEIVVKFDNIESILASVNNILINLQKESNSEAGEIFSVLEKISKISDSILAIAEQAKTEQLVPELKTTIVELQQLIDTSSSAIAKVEEVIESAIQTSIHANSVLSQYADPAGIISKATENKLPNMIDNADVNLVYMQDILKEVYLQREQLSIAIISLNKTLKMADKTLEGVNNNPLFKDGIETENKANDSIEVNEN